MKRPIAILLCLLCLFLSGCTPVINSARDEIRLYDWIGEYENGNRAELSFSGTNAQFTVTNPDFKLDISGLCSLTDDKLLVFSEQNQLCYEFSYVLHGDSVELYYHGDPLILEKKVE